MPNTATRPDLTTHRPAHTTAALVLVQNDRVLLHRHGKDATAYASMWDLPLVEVAAETAPEDAVLTGAKALLGVEVQALRLLGARDDLVDGSCWRRFLYQVEVTGEPTLSGMTRWYSRGEFRDVFQLNPLVADLTLFDE